MQRQKRLFPKFALVFAFIQVISSETLECYSCVHTGPAPNRLCVELKPDKKRMDTTQVPESIVKGIEGASTSNHNEPAKLTACATFCGVYDLEQTFLRYRTDNANETNIGKCRRINIEYGDMQRIHGVSCYCNTESYCNRHEEKEFEGYGGDFKCEIRKDYNYNRPQSSGSGNLKAVASLLTLAAILGFVRV